MDNKAELLRKLSRKCDELALDFLDDRFTDEMRTLASFRVQEAMAGVLTLLGEIEPICDSCGHLTRKHFDTYGCQHEGKDQYESGYAPMASGTCGCKAWTVEESDATQSESTVTN